VEDASLDALADLVRPLGGDGGCDTRDDHAERWIVVPRG
jgi:hypothetical protein